MAPRPAGSRSFRNPGKGHSLGVATQGLLERQQPILVRHTRASANQRPYCSCVPPAPALFSCFPCPVPVIAAVAAAAARPHRSLGTGLPWRCSVPPVAFIEDESLRSCVPTPSRPLAHFHLATGHPCNYGYLNGSDSVEGEFPSSLPLGA